MRAGAVLRRALPVRAAVLALCALAAFPLRAQSGADASIEYKLLVEAERAVVRASPDAASAALIVLARGATLSSFEQAGDWYRVVVDVGEGGIVLVGYLPAAEVRIVGQKVRESPNPWSMLDREFRGVGLSLRVSVGRTGLPAGDFGRGARSWYEGVTGEMLARGWRVRDGRRDFRFGGFEVGLDALWKLSPRFEIAAGAGYLEEESTSWEEFSEDSWGGVAYLNVQTGVKVIPLRLGIVARQPLFKNVSAYLEGGGILAFASYTGSLQNQASFVSAIVQSVTARAYGGYAALGLELALTTRGSVFLEARGGSVRFSRFDGSEKGTVWRWGRLPETVDIEGRLYYGSDDGGAPGLAVRPVVGGGYPGFREVSYVLRSLRAAAGWRLKF